VRKSDPTQSGHGHADPVCLALAMPNGAVVLCFTNTLVAGMKADIKDAALRVIANAPELNFILGS